MRSRALLLSLTLGSFAILPHAFVACGGTNDAATSDAGVDGAADGAGNSDDDGSGDEISFAPVDAGPPDASQCLHFPDETDPVGLCIQKVAILGVHGVLGDGGVPAAWSVDTLEPATDGGALVHDVRDDVAYGAVLAAYQASAAAYSDTSIDGVVSSDLLSIARLVEGEVLPDDYDGALYLQLRRFAAGLRAANLISDATAIDALALRYGEAIFTAWFHPLSAGSGASDAGGDAGAGDGILGAPSGGGFAYSADKAATGAAALMELATRAANGTLTPVESPTEAGVDAAASADPADALKWASAARAVFTHLVNNARDPSGLYFTGLQTGVDAGPDQVTDDGLLLTETQGAVALADVRMAALLTTTPIGGLPPTDFSNETVSILTALQIVPSLWDTTATAATLPACNVGNLDTCGSGYFVSVDETRTSFDFRKSTRANARLFSALQRASLLATLPQKNDLVPMRALFTTTGTSSGAFFSVVPSQSAYVDDVTAAITLTVLPDGGGIDGGPSDPLGRYYSAAATAEAIEGMNDQWLGFNGVIPPIFQ